MVDMARKEIVPAIESYTKSLAEAFNAKTAALPGLSCKYEKAEIAKLSALVDEIYSATASLEEAVIALRSAENITEESVMIRDILLQKMAELRVVCDEAETITADSYWPFPTYCDLLFGVH